MSPLKRLRRRTSSTGSPPATGTAAPAEASEPAETPEPAAAPGVPGAPGGRRGFSLATSTPVLLLQAAHPRQALLTALALAMAAALAGRPTHELGLVFGTVLVGQAILGWDNDLVDRVRDRRHDLPGKPIAAGLLDPGTVWFTLTCALLLVVPLSIAAGTIGGSAYLISLLVVLLGNRFLRANLLAFVPWVVSFGLYPAYLTYGGWNGVGSSTPPTITVTVLAAALGLCVHVLRSLPGLVQDNQDGYRTLPLRIALRIGAPKLLVIGAVVTTAVVVALLIAGRSVGLS